MPAPPLSPLARALGRLPSGLYLATALHRGEPIGFVASFVMQMGFEPPLVCLAVGKQRGPLDALREHGGFALSILDLETKGSAAPFLKQRPNGPSPFEGLALEHAPSGAPVMSEALAWLDCRLRSEHATHDHVVLFAEVTAGALLHEGEPHVHLRRNGLAY